MSVTENKTVENAETIFKTAKAFEIAVVKDPTAGPLHPAWGDGYQAALINYKYLGHELLTSAEAIGRMR